VGALTGGGEDRGCIILVEHFDVGLLQYIMAVHKGAVFKESIQQATTMMERVDKKAVLQVTYEQANYKSFDPDGNFKGSYRLGRYCARHGGSMQGMRRVIRNTLAYESYHDIDMANAHPNFAAQLFHHLPIPTYLAYASDRQHFIEDFTSATGLGGSYCKQIVASIMNGSYLFGINDKDWKEMVSKPNVKQSMERNGISSLKDLNIRLGTVAFLSSLRDDRDIIFQQIQHDYPAFYDMCSKKAKGRKEEYRWHGLLSADG